MWHLVFFPLWTTIKNNWYVFLLQICSWECNQTPLPTEHTDLKLILTTKLRSMTAQGRCKTQPKNKQ